jgi:hypothetical protein
MACDQSSSRQERASGCASAAEGPLLYNTENRASDAFAGQAWVPYWAQRHGGAPRKQVGNVCAIKLKAQAQRDTLSHN